LVWEAGDSDVDQRLSKAVAIDGLLLLELLIAGQRLEYDARRRIPFDDGGENVVLEVEDAGIVLGQLPLIGIRVIDILLRRRVLVGILQECGQ
jgi:hypothetical protein